MKKSTNTVKTNSETPYLVYGLSFKTIHDDSRWHDDHQLWLESEDQRDSVYSDWDKGKYWDKKKGDEINHPTPSPNYNHSLTKKISKFCTEGTKQVTTYKLSSDEYDDIMTALSVGDLEELRLIFSGK